MDLLSFLQDFRAKTQGNLFEQAKATQPEFRSLKTANLSIPIIEKEFWTSQPRQANALHEISYRACFKPQLWSAFELEFMSFDRT